MRTRSSRVLWISSLGVVLLATAILAEGDSAGSSADVFSDHGDVLMLDHKSFHPTLKEKTKDGAAVVVLFYAPWSDMCQALMPAYKEAATALQAEDPPLYLAMLDADPENNRKIAQRYGAKGFPTFKVFKNVAKTVIDYKGGRLKEDLIKLAKASQGQSWTEVFSYSEIEERVAANERVVVFGGRELGRAASSAWKAFQVVSDNLQSKQYFTMLAAFKPEVVEQAGIDAPAIQLITNYKGEGITKQVTGFNVNISTAVQVERWLYLFSSPRVASTADPTHASLLRDSKLPVLHVIIKGGSDREGVRSTLSSAAEGVAGLLDPPNTKPLAAKKLLTFALTEEDDEMGKELMTEMGLASSDLPVTVIRVIKKPLRPSLWQLGANLKVGDAGPITAFATDFLEDPDKLRRFVKSDPRPPPPTKQDPVQVVVGDTFEEIVMDPEKHVLISFYAPWCPHSQRLEPEYHKTAAKFWGMRKKKPEKYGNLVIAKMDAAANDSPVDRIQATAYPTIMYVGAGNNTARRYSGPKEHLDLIKWVKVQAGLLADKSKEEL